MKIHWLLFILSGSNSLRAGTCNFIHCFLAQWGNPKNCLALWAHPSQFSWERATPAASLPSPAALRPKSRMQTPPCSSWNRGSPFPFQTQAQSPKPHQIHWSDRDTELQLKWNSQQGCSEVSARLGAHRCSGDVPRAGGLLIPDSQMQIPPPHGWQATQGHGHMQRTSQCTAPIQHGWGIPCFHAPFPISMLLHCPSSMLDGAVMRLNATKRNGRMDERYNSCGCFECFFFIGWFLPLIFLNLLLGFRGLRVGFDLFF